MTHEQFKLIAPQLTADLAQAILDEFNKLGDKAKELSWFSSKPYNV